MASLTVKDVVSNAAAVMGVKAVWGVSEEAVMCFATPKGSTTATYSHAQSVAEKAAAQPFFFTIGGGGEVPGKLRGRVLELVRCTSKYGATTAFVRDEDLRKRLEKWQAAVVLQEVYALVGQPHLIEDLGLADRTILLNAFDRVVGTGAQLEELWQRLKDWPVEIRQEIAPPPGFYDNGKLELFISRYPTIKAGSEEGQKIWKQQIAAERDRKLSSAAKASNKARNGGLVVCESCGLADELTKMFDAHHPRPIAAGRRMTTADDLVVLCPTCHRVAHQKAPDVLAPLDVAEVADVIKRLMRVEPVARG